MRQAEEEERARAQEALVRRRGLCAHFQSFRSCLRAGLFRTRRAAAGVEQVCSPCHVRRCDARRSGSGRTVTSAPLRRPRPSPSAPSCAAVRAAPAHAPRHPQQRSLTPATTPRLGGPSGAGS